MNKLQDEGYAPLMRFGQHYLHIFRVDPETGKQIKDAETGETESEFFGLFETKDERDRAEKALREEFKDQPNVEFDTGTKSEQDWKLYQGVSPETMELFAKQIGLDKDAVWQEWYRSSIANRSALKRLIHRKGTAGFSEDGSRVLASFLTSNGRRAAQQYHRGDIQKAIDSFPRQMGAEKDEAIKLMDYLNNPNEESSGIRSLMFMHFIGG